MHYTSMQFRLITCGILWRYYKRQYIDKTLEIMPVYASERSERGKIMHFYISNLLYKLV